MVMWKWKGKLGVASYKHIKYLKKPVKKMTGFFVQEK